MAISPPNPRSNSTKLPGDWRNGKQNYEYSGMKVRKPPYHNFSVGINSSNISKYFFDSEKTFSIIDGRMWVIKDKFVVS